MTQTIVKISSQRQISLPAAMLGELGVDRHDQLNVRLVGKQLVIEPHQSVVDKVGGSLAHLVPVHLKGKSWEEVSAKAFDLAAKEIAYE